MANDNTTITLTLKNSSKDIEEAFVTNTKNTGSPIFTYPNKVGDNVKCDATLTSIKYDMNMYEAHHFEIQMDITESYNLSSVSKCAVGCSANLKFSDGTVFGESLFVLKAIPTIANKDKDGDDKYIKLIMHIYSLDKLMDLQKFSQAFTSKRLGKNIIADNINRFDKLNYGLTYKWEPRIMSYSDTENDTDRSKELIQPYLVQYNETFRTFINRVANRSGEFLYWHNGQLQYGFASEEIKQTFEEYPRAEDISVTIRQSHSDPDDFMAKLEDGESLAYDMEIDNSQFTKTLDKSGKTYETGDPMESIWWNASGKVDPVKVIMDIIFSYASSGGLKDFLYGYITKVVIDNPLSEVAKLKCRETQTKNRNTFPIITEDDEDDIKPQKQSYGFVEAEQKGEITYKDDNGQDKTKEALTHFSTLPYKMKTYSNLLSTSSPLATAFYAKVRDLGQKAEKNAIDINLKANAPHLHLGQIITCDSDRYIITAIHGEFNSDNTASNELTVSVHAIPVTVHNGQTAYLPGPLEQPVRVMDGNLTATISAVDSPFSDNSVRVRFKWQGPISVTLNADELKACRYKAMSKAYSGSCETETAKCTTEDERQAIYDNHYMVDEPLVPLYQYSADILRCVTLLNELNKEMSDIRKQKKPIDTEIQNLDKRYNDLTVKYPKLKAEIEELKPEKDIIEKYLKFGTLPTEEFSKKYLCEETAKAFKEISEDLLAIKQWQSELEKGNITQEDAKQQIGPFKKDLEKQRTEHLSPRLSSIEGIITPKQKELDNIFVEKQEGDLKAEIEQVDAVRTEKKKTSDSLQIKINELSSEYTKINNKYTDLYNKYCKMTTDLPTDLDENQWKAKVETNKNAFDRVNKFKAEYDKEVKEETKKKYNAKRLEDSTPWIRMTTPMAGKVNKCYMMPTTDTEVLVGFENGNPERPYVIGSLFNTENKDGKIGKDGFVGNAYQLTSELGTGIVINNERINWTDITNMIGFPIFKSIVSGMSSVVPSGTLVSSPIDMGGNIQLKDKLGFYNMTMSSKERKVSIKSAMGDITLSAFTGITISAPNGDVKINGKNVIITAGDKIQLKSGTNKDIVEDFMSNPAANITAMISQAVLKTVKDLIGDKLVDLTMVRSFWEVIARPINGSMQLHSNRHMLLEAGKGAAEVPIEARCASQPEKTSTVFPNYPYYLIKELLDQMKHTSGSYIANLADAFNKVKNIPTRGNNNNIDKETERPSVEVFNNKGDMHMEQLSESKKLQILKECVTCRDNVWKPIADNDNKWLKWCPYPEAPAQNDQPDPYRIGRNDWLRLVKETAQKAADLGNAYQACLNAENGMNDVISKIQKALKRVLGSKKLFKKADIATDLQIVIDQNDYKAMFSPKITRDDATTDITIGDYLGGSADLAKYTSDQIVTDLTISNRKICHAILKMLYNNKLILVVKHDQELQPGKKDYETTNSFPEFEANSTSLDGFGNDWDKFILHCMPYDSIEKTTGSIIVSTIVDSLSNFADNAVDFKTWELFFQQERKLWDTSNHPGMILMSDEKGSKTIGFDNGQPKSYDNITLTSVIAEMKEDPNRKITGDPVAAKKPRYYRDTKKLSNFNLFKKN